MVGWVRQSIVMLGMVAAVVMLGGPHAIAGQWPVLQAAGSVEERAELTPPTATAHIATTFPTLIAAGAIVENSQELAAVLHAMPLPPQAQARAQMKTRITEALVALEERALASRPGGGQAADRFAPTTTAKPAASAQDVTTSLPSSAPVAVDVAAGPQPVPVPAASGPTVPSSLPTVRESAGTVPSSTTAARGTAASAPRDAVPLAGAPVPSDETTVASRAPAERPVVMTPLFLPTPTARTEEPAAELPTDRQRTAREPTILTRTPDAESDDTDRRTSSDTPAATIPTERETSDTDTRSTDTRTTDTRTTDTATRPADEQTRTSETQSTDVATRTTDGQTSTSDTRSTDTAAGTADTRDTSTTATPTEDTRTGETDATSRDTATTTSPPSDERVTEPANTSTETGPRESARTSIVDACTSRTLDCAQAASWALTERALGLAVAPRDHGGPIALVPIDRDGVPLVIALDPRTQRTATCLLPKTGAPVEGNTAFQLSAGGAKQVAQWFATASRAMTEPPATDTAIPPCVAELGTVVRLAASVTGATEDEILYRYDSTKTDSYAIDRDGTLLRVEEGKQQTSTVSTLGTLGVTPRYVVERTATITTPIVSGRAATTAGTSTEETQLVVGSDRSLVTLDPRTWAVVGDEQITFRQPDDTNTLVLAGLSATSDCVLTVHQTNGTAVVSWIPVSTTR